MAMGYSKRDPYVQKALEDMEDAIRKGHPNSSEMLKILHAYQTSDQVYGVKSFTTNTTTAYDPSAAGTMYVTDTVMGPYRVGGYGSMANGFDVYTTQTSVYIPPKKEEKKWVELEITSLKRMNRWFGQSNDWEVTGSFTKPNTLTQKHFRYIFSAKDATDLYQQLQAKLGT